jgi:WD40 repeat protein
VYHVAFSPDGTTLASAGYHDDVRLWDPFTNDMLAVFPASYAQKGIGFNRDGTRLIFRSSTTDFLGKCNFSVIDTAAGTPLVTARHNNDGILFQSLHRGQDFLSIADNAKYTPGVGETQVSNDDGSYIADSHEKSEIHLLDPATRKTIKRIGRHDAMIFSVAFSPDSSLIASGDGEGVIKVWDVDSGDELAVLQGHIGRVYSICFSPDGDRIASSGNDSHIMIWNTETFERVAVMREHSSYVHSVCFSPDGTMLASASGDGTVRIWDTVLPANRWKQVQEMEKLRSETRPLVDRLLDELKNPLDIADHLRTHETLGKEQRKAALRVLLKRIND